MMPGRVTIHAKPAAHAPTAHSPVHSRSRGRKENAACMSRTKKYMKLA